jgi:hypothetical protein
MYGPRVCVDRINETLLIRDHPSATQFEELVHGLPGATTARMTMIADRCQLDDRWVSSYTFPGFDKYIGYSINSN